MDILQVADAVSREKGIEREEVISAMEEAIQKAARSKYGHESEVRAAVDRATGEIKLSRYRVVVEDDAEIENESVQVTVSRAQRIQPGAKPGDEIIDDLPPLDFGRIAAQTAKQVIVQRVRDAERRRQYAEYKDRIGEIVSGVIKRVDFGNVNVDLGRAEAVIRRDECIPREHLKNGDRVRAYIADVREEQRGPQIFLSRTHPQFMAQLFKQEVPEIYDGVIEIKAVARDPGSRAKIAVITHDHSIDPVGACVGMRGSRVQAVVAELQGEKIDIIPWTEDTATFVVNALAPAEVTKVVLDEDNKRIDVVVPEEQQSLAIGRRGQNVRLASILSGWNIDIMTEEEESTKRTEETTQRSEMFMNAMDVDDMIAHLLISEGFYTIEDVAYIDLAELAGIEGFNEDIATELQNRARSFIEEREKELKVRAKELKIAKELIEHPELNMESVVKLGEANVKTLDDLGDLAGDELVEIVGAKVINIAKANDIIMAIREKWFAEEEGREDETAA